MSVVMKLLALQFQMAFVTFELKKRKRAASVGWPAVPSRLLNELAKLWGKHQTSCILVEHLVNGLVEVDEEEHSPRANSTQ
jgi:hypothetical protein